MAEDSLGVGDIVDGRFRIEHSLGRGAFGRVWRAHDLEHSRIVALKILKPALAENAGVLARFGREVDILTRLQHPGVVRYVAASNRGPHRYLAMEYVEGATLLVAMSERAHGDPFTPQEVSTIVAQVASALKAAHDDHVVHRDLKPANIILSPGPVARVLDFGVAKVALTPHERTTVGRLVGTLMYMSPEQLAGQDVDHRADVFALATIAFELLTLRRPYARDARGEPFPIAELPIPTGELNSHYAVLRRIAMEPRPKVSRHRDDVALEVDDVVASALHVVAAERTPDCVVFAEALASALAMPSARRIRARAETLGPEDLEASEPSAGRKPRAETIPIDDPEPGEALTSVLPQAMTQTAEDTAELFRPAVVPEPSRRTPTWLPIVVAVALAFGVAATFVSLRGPDSNRRPLVPLEIPARLPEAEPRAATPTVAADAGFQEIVAPAPPPARPRPRTAPPPPTKTVRAPPLRPDAGVKAPRSAAEVRRLARELKTRADTIEDPAARARIKRCASLAALRGAAEDYDACLADYRRTSP